MEELGYALRLARERRGLTQTQVMNLTGINNKTLSGYENNIAEPDLQTLTTLLRLYRVSADRLLHLPVSAQELPADEARLLTLYRAFPEEQRQQLMLVLETLSIIAYKQPVTKMEIEKIRGVKSDHAVNRLVEYNLVYEAGRLDAPGRPALFATTEEFLRRFGVGSVQDLPDLGPEQEAEIKAEVEEELQLKLEELTVEAASGEAAETAETAMEAAATAEETAVAREPEA